MDELDVKTLKVIRAHLILSLEYVGILLGRQEQEESKKEEDSKPGEGHE